MNHRSFNFSRHLRTVALMLLMGSSLTAQDEGLKFYDNTYVDNIKTVRLHVDGFPSSYPLIDLDGGARLRLSFDDLSDEVRRYSYKFIHCDQDWQPSALSELEFNSGFT
ncbi:MAG: type IX secretion system plug protein domain-containing protein, partial [Bacteroidota bacterium]